MNSAERLKDVSSLYGTGAVCCWLCIVCSVFVSWTVNKKTGGKDSITNDLIAVITLPNVAAVHLIYQVAIFPGSRAGILKSLDLLARPKIAAIEAPLNICDTFAALALILFVVAAYKFHIKRCLVVGLSGLLCFGAEAALFFLSPPPPIRQSNLGRPYLLSEPSAMIPVMLGTFILAFAAIIGLVEYGLQKLHKNPKTPTPSQDGSLEHAAQHNDLAKLEQAQGRFMRVATLGSILFMPLSLFASISTSLGAWGIPAPGAAHSFSWRLAFFLPASNSHMGNLDQAVALGGGAVTLAFSVYSAYKASSARNGKSH